MSFFGSIVDKIVHYAGSAFAPGAGAGTTTGTTASAPAAAATAAPAADTVAATDTVPAPAATEATAPAASSPATPAAASLESVDVGAVLAALDAQKGGGLNWQGSIVDLLKLLDLDSSLAARRTLANELGVHVGADGSAEENVALHKAVVEKLAENGGRIPAGMRN